jgi:hypothetical protein
MARIKEPSWVFLAITLLWLGSMGFSPVQAAYQVGDHVSDFTLQNWNGQWMSLYGQTNRIVVLEFWFYS